MPSKYVKKDLYGLRFGRLVVIGKQIENSVETGRWLCRCDCGREKAFSAPVLSNGHVRDCGCICESAEYQTWKAMKRRCYVPTSIGFHNYGGRGIAVCERWIHSFENFLSDMGRKPSPSHSIDRIDNDGNYEPGNCKWASRAEQSANRRPNHRIEFEGETVNAAELARRIGSHKNTIASRIRRGDDPTAPVASQYSEFGYIEYDGKRMTAKQWAKLCNMPHSTILRRLRRGDSVEQTLTAPSRKNPLNTGYRHD